MPTTRSPLPDSANASHKRKSLWYNFVKRNEQTPLAVDVDEHALIHGLSEDEVRHAWENSLRKQHRPAPNEDYAAAIGVTQAGDMVQMVAVQNENGYLVFHAMKPPTEKVLRELGLSR